MQRVTVNLPPFSDITRSREDLLTIAENFERRAKDILENYQNTHKQKNRERYDKVLVAYTTWRDAARSLRLVATGAVTIEQLRKATER